MRFVVFVTIIATLVYVVKNEDYRTNYKAAMAKYGAVDGLQALRSEKDEKLHYQSFVKFSKMVKANNDNPDSTYTAENNMFSIQTEEERKLHLGRNSSRSNFVKREEMRLTEREVKIWLRASTDNVDYSSQLPAVKDQKTCGSCWTFGATPPLEYQVNRRKDSVVSYSEQELLDCVYSTDGCNGGYQESVYKWMNSHGNHLARNKDHPYVNADGDCTYKKLANGFAGFKVAAKTLKAAGDQKMLIAMANKEIGVLTVAVHVNDAFESYKSGVFSDTACQKRDNHAVSATGYGIRDTVPYFRIRNSWGTSWGEGGYIDIQRSQTKNLNMCRVSEFAEYPVVTVDGGGGKDDDDDDDNDDDGNNSCTWVEKKSTILMGRIGNWKQNKMSLDDAKTACVKNKSCVGISCRSRKSKLRCGMKSKSAGKKNKKFVSYLLKCSNVRALV